MLPAIHLRPRQVIPLQDRPPSASSREKPGATGRGPRTCYQRRPDHPTSNCTPSPRPCLCSCPLTARSVRRMSGQKQAACAEGSYSTSVAELRLTSQAALALLSRALVPDPQLHLCQRGHYRRPLHRKTSAASERFQNRLGPPHSQHGSPLLPNPAHHIRSRMVLVERGRTKPRTNASRGVPSTVSTCSATAAGSARFRVGLCRVCAGSLLHVSKFASGR